MQRKFGDFAGFWRLGIQWRGACHFDLLLFVGPSIGSVGELRRFISSSWYEVTGEVSEGHLRAGTRVETIQKWKEATIQGRHPRPREDVGGGNSRGRSPSLPADPSGSPNCG